MFHVAGNRETIKDLKTSISKKNMKKNGRKRKLFNSISKGRKHKFVQGANRARIATEIVTPIFRFPKPLDSHFHSFPTFHSCA